jgi:Magnesium chelatase, subunit ChlI
MRGSPGAGTSLLARRPPTILPAMTLAEAVETTRVHRVAGLTDGRTALVTTRPCRAPPHSISDVGLIGGGAVPLPGEVSLAHHGVLFLDELPEFKRHVLEVLRQPLEDGVIRRQSPARPRSARLGRACRTDADPLWIVEGSVGAPAGSMTRASRVSILHSLLLPRSPHRLRMARR